MAIWLLSVAFTIFDECIQYDWTWVWQKNKRLQLGSPSTCSGRHIYIYVVLAPRSMWATWQAASTGKCTPSPPSNAQASTFSYFSHTHPPRARSSYLSLLVLIVHWLWVWAQVERVLLGHLMLVRAFFVLLSAHPYSQVGNVDVSGKWKCLVYEQSLHRAEKHHLAEHLTTLECRSQRKQTMSRLQCASEHNLQKSFKVKK